MRKSPQPWPALAVLALAAALSSAPAAAADLKEMRAELTKVQDEIKVVETKITDNAKEQQDIKTESAHLQTESDELQAQVLAHEANRPAVASVCSGTYPPEQMAAAQARCDAQRLPFNQVVEGHNKERQALIDRNEALVRKDNRRLAAARELTRQYEKLFARKHQLQTAILEASGSRCILSCQAIPCTTLNCDALKQCEQNCWDGALRREAAHASGSHRRIPPLGAREAGTQRPQDPRAAAPAARSVTPRGRARRFRPPFALRSMRGGGTGYSPGGPRSEGRSRSPEWP